MIAPDGTGAVSGPEDCAHLLPGATGIIEPNPLRKYPDVVVKNAEPVIAARESVDVQSANIAPAGDSSSSFPWAWLLGILAQTCSCLCPCTGGFLAIDFSISLQQGGVAVGVVLVGSYWCMTAGAL